MCIEQTYKIKLKTKCFRCILSRRQFLPRGLVNNTITLYKCDQRTKYGTNNHSRHSWKEVSRPAFPCARGETRGSKAFSNLEKLLLNKL